MVDDDVLAFRPTDKTSQMKHIEPSDTSETSCRMVEVRSFLVDFYQGFLIDASTYLDQSFSI